MFLILAVLLSANVIAQANGECVKGQERCFKESGQDHKQICSEGVWQSVLVCSEGCNLTDDKATCMSPPKEKSEVVILGPEEVAGSEESLVSSTISKLLTALIIPLLAFVLFLLSSISILTSKNKTGWKILWIVICLTIIGILVYFIVGRKKRISKAMASGAAEIKEEQRVEEEEKESIAEEKPQSLIPLTPKEIPDEFKQIVDYIKTSFAQGFSKDQINQALIKSGWAQDKIDEAFRFA